MVRTKDSHKPTGTIFQRSGKFPQCSSKHMHRTSVGKAIPKPKVSKDPRVRHRIHCLKVEQLSRKTMRELIQFGPFARMIKENLEAPVTRISSDVVPYLMEAVATYLHSIIETAYEITKYSGKRTTLMVCDVSCSVKAKGSQIIAAP